MARYKQPSIEEQGGIAQYLDSTAEQHNGISWRLFDLFCRVRVPNTVIARIMGRDETHPLASDTVKDWKERRKRWLISQKEASQKLKDL